MVPAPHVKFRSRSLYEQAPTRIGFRVVDFRPIYGLMTLLLGPLPVAIVNVLPPCLYLVDCLLLPPGFRRTDNMRLITCEKAS